MKIVVLTSNKYLHCLPPLAYLFNRFWQGEPEVTVVRYDAKPPALPANFRNFAIGKQDEYDWSSGLRYFLERMEDDLVLLMLEDYFLCRDAQVNVIAWLADYMTVNPSIVKIDLTNDRLKVPHHEWDVAGMIRSDDKALFQTSLQAAIWRRDFLLSALQDGENPWQFEKKGTKRLIARRERGFDGVILGMKTPPLEYVNAIGGEGNMPQVWAVQRMPKWMRDELNAKGLL